MPGLVASYDIQPGNGEGLFWFRRFINLSLTYLDTYPHTYSPDPHGALYLASCPSPYYFGSRPSDHYFRSVCLFVCAEFFSAVFDPIWIKLGHTLHVRV